MAQIRIHGPAMCSPGSGRVAVARPSAPPLRRCALAEIKQIEPERDRHAQRLAVPPLVCTVH